MKRKQSCELKRKGESDAVGLICLAAAFLLPLFMLFVFVRLLLTHGAPVWYLALHGILTVLMVIQVIIFLRLGFLRAMHDYWGGKRRERSEE